MMATSVTENRGVSAMVRRDEGMVLTLKRPRRVECTVEVKGVEVGFLTPLYS